MSGKKEFLVKIYKNKDGGYWRVIGRGFYHMGDADDESYRLERCTSFIKEGSGVVLGKNTLKETERDYNLVRTIVCRA